MDWRALGQIFCFTGGPVAVVAAWQWHQAVDQARYFSDVTPGWWPVVCILGAVFAVVGIGLVAAARD